MLNALFDRSIAFAPLKSTYLAESTKRASFLRTEKYHQSRRQYNSAHATVVAHVPGIELPWTSAKSIYRLADSAFPFTTNDMLLLPCVQKSTFLNSHPPLGTT